MKSEDGMDLYEGDDCIIAILYNKAANPMLAKKPDTFKVFSTKEVAEKYIKEKNEPEYAELSILGLIYRIYKNGNISIAIHDANTIHNTSFTISTMEEFIKPYDATFKSNS